MRVIARKTLRQFVYTLKGGKDQKAVKSALDSWFHEVQQAEWKSPADVVRAYANASIVGSDRVVFNIKGNDYRLVVAINYRLRIVFIKWIGSHAEYDHIDCENGAIWTLSPSETNKTMNGRCGAWRNSGIPRKAPLNAMSWASLPR